MRGDDLEAIVAAPLMDAEQRERIIRMAADKGVPPLALLRYVHRRASGGAPDAIGSLVIKP